MSALFSKKTAYVRSTFGVLKAGNKYYEQSEYHYARHLQRMAATSSRLATMARISMVQITTMLRRSYPVSIQPPLICANQNIDAQVRDLYSE